MSSLSAQLSASVWHTYDMITNRGREALLPNNRHLAKLPENSTNIILSGANGLLINGSAAATISDAHWRTLWLMSHSVSSESFHW
jgi:hypothetical protein